MRALTTELQRALEEVYCLDAVPPVEAFTVPPGLLSLGEHVRESLLVQHDGDETLLGLYIAEEVLAGAAQFAAQSSGELDEFCVATEGVSHFVYFTFCGAAQDRPVSQIELELQAEIDKFVVLRFVCGEPRADLVLALFDRMELRPDLSPAERERYTLANQAGRRYARWMDQRLRRGEGDRAVADARALYRKPLAAKLEHIARAA